MKELEDAVAKASTALTVASSNKKHKKDDIKDNTKQQASLTADIKETEEAISENEDNLQQATKKLAVVQEQYNALITKWKDLQRQYETRSIGLSLDTSGNSKKPASAADHFMRIFFSLTCLT